MKKILRKSKKILNELVLFGIAGMGQCMPSKGIPILHYHSVDGENQGSVTREAFYKQMQYFFDRGFTLVSLDDLVQYLTLKKEPPAKCAVLTFDDGYKTVFTIAFPILRKFNYSATIFLTTGRIGQTSDWDLREDVYGLPLMSRENVLEMHHHGIDFGAHSHTHPHLTRISQTDMRKEITLSKEKLEEILGKPAKFFAYPYGDYNDEVKNILQEYDFTAACTTQPGLNAPSGDLLALRRSGVFRDTSLTGLRCRLNGSFSWYFYSKRWLKGNEYYSRRED